MPVLEEAVEGFKAEWVALINDPSTPGTLANRVTLGEALGWFGDPRIGWTEHHFPPVPAGPYVAGTIGEKVWPGDEDLDPARHVDAFRIGRYPVTVGQFQAFMTAPDRDDPRWWAGVEPTDVKEWESLVHHLARHAPNRPVTGATWFEARAFCAWATVRHPPAFGGCYRLPTSSEWEKAARGGGGDQRIFPWGDEAPDEYRANFNALELGDPTPVGLFPAGRGPFEALDQAGNVWEWCLDEVKVPWSDSARVLRGGAFRGDPQWLRVSYRLGDAPQRRGGGVGFRCVCVPAEDP